MKRMTTGLCAATLMAMGAAGTAQADSDEPILITMNNWTSQNVLAYVTGNLLAKLGYEVEYVPSATPLQFPAIADGDLHFQVEVWEGSMLNAFEKAKASGGLIDMGDHDAVTREDWWVPAYMVEKCPGLPDWKALDKCAELFATAETSPKGRFVGPPADWGKHYSERIESLGMNFEEVPVGQAATLWAELQAAYDRKEGVVLFNWTPNFIEAKFDGVFVEFPEYEAACLSDPAWGINQEMLYDCGAPASGWLKKAAWAGVEEDFPKAWELFGKINFTNAQIAAAAAMVDVEGISPEEAAQKWIGENEAVWSAWLPK